MAWAAAIAMALGSLHEGESKGAAADYNARTADENAKLSRLQAREEVRRFRIASKKQLGAMRAAYAASGVTMEGSPMDVMEESAATAALDALTLQHAGDIKAYGYEREAALERFKGRSARTAGYLGAGSSAAQGAS